MRALVFTRPGDVEMQNLPLPLAGPDEVVVTVRASGVCGSELHGYRSVGMRVPPLVMGHEFTGTTPGGKRVVANPLLACRDCDLCRRGLRQVCRKRGLIGVSRPGGFAEQVSVPASCLHPVPRALSFAAATLIEPLANGVHAWSLARGADGAPAETVAVVGAGAIGLVCALVARSKGADVVICDTSAERRTVAERLGLPVARTLTGEFDAVMDAVGGPATRQASIAHSRPGGVAVWLGLLEDRVELTGNAVVRAEKRIVGSFAYSDDDFAAALDLSPTLDLSWTTQVPLSQAATIFDELARGRSDIVKAVLVPDAYL